MLVTRISPVELRLSQISENDVTLMHQLKLATSYQDLQKKFAYERFRKSAWARSKIGDVAFQDKLKEMQGEVNQCVLRGLEDGTYSLPAGFLPFLKNVPFRDECTIPPRDPKRWSRVFLKHDLRPYQEEAVEALLATTHGAVSISTGGGKTSVLLEVIRRTGLKAVVTAPLTAIADQLYRDFLTAFGKKTVGRLYGGKKETEREIVIAVDDSVTGLKPDTDQWRDVASAKVWIADESHGTAASTLEAASYGVLRDVPYRYFVSATQIRGDGRGPVLEGIIGPVVYRKDLSSLVAEGYLARPIFEWLDVPALTKKEYRDAKTTTREELYYNKHVGRTVAECANMFVEHHQVPVLILVEEIRQFGYISPHLKYSHEFAHGPLNAAQKKELAPAYWSSEPLDQVKRFDARAFPILVGTSCVSIGVDFQHVGAIFYLRGGSSEVNVRQAIGRGTRKPPGKEAFYFFDVRVDHPALKKMSQKRDKIYKECMR